MNHMWDEDKFGCCTSVQSSAFPTFFMDFFVFFNLGKMLWLVFLCMLNWNLHTRESFTRQTTNRYQMLIFSVVTNDQHLNIQMLAMLRVRGYLQIFCSAISLLRYITIYWFRKSINDKCSNLHCDILSTVRVSKYSTIIIIWIIK